MASNLEPSSRDGVSAHGPWLERLMFKYRWLFLVLMVASTVFLGWQASRLKAMTSFDSMIPTGHEYIQNFLKHRKELAGLGNVVRITVQVRQGDIFDANYLETLRKITDTAFSISGVNRPAMRSLWTPNVRWVSVTEAGLEGGQVIPANYDGSVKSLAQVRQNVELSGQVGQLVANDFKSTVVYLPLLEIDPQTGQRLDYARLAKQLEQDIRVPYSQGNIQIGMTGFARLIGDLMEGALLVAQFFALAVVITLVMLWWYSRSIRSTLAVLGCSLVAVVWQLGLMNLLGKGLDPYSMLVPFLIFAIAVSHGVQVINAVVHQQGGGLHRIEAARMAFRGLYVAGLVALISDGLGFATLGVIDIGVIQNLAIAASLGVGAIVLTNLVLLPLMMSFVGVEFRAIARLQQNEGDNHKLWQVLGGCTNHRVAFVILLASLGLMGVGVWGSLQVQIGDLDKGAPELRADSRYNLDTAYLAKHYGTSTDVFVVMVSTPKDGCIRYSTQVAVDAFQWMIEQVPGVQNSVSLVDRTKLVISAYSEGDIKWTALNRNQFVLNGTINTMNLSGGLFSPDCSFMPIIVFLKDHKAQTLQRVEQAAKSWIAQTDTGEAKFLLAAGNAGIDTATNEVVEAAQLQMLLWVYGVVCVLVWLAFRNWRTVLCIVAPLALTSLLCQTLMVWLGIGVKVSTLPVIALGAGIGVDYGIYMYGKLQTYLEQGWDFGRAWAETLRTTGKAVIFTGITLAIGVATWAFSPIKFQADMGILLTFMFLWNMLSAVVVLPALAAVLQQRKAR